MSDAEPRSGLEFLRAMIAGEVAQPPIGGLMNMALVEVSEGRARFTGRPGPEHYNPMGTVHGGYAATLLDSALGCAVQTTLGPAQGYATVDLAVKLFRPLTAETGVVEAVGTVIHVGRTVATAEARLTDAAGRLLAHGTTTCMIFAARGQG